MSALALLLFAFFPRGIDAIGQASPFYLIPGLALLYLVGILTDRIADWLTGKPLARLRWPHEENYPDWKASRRRLLKESAFFRDNWLYAQSRKRIVRGWILNSIFLMVSSAIFALRQDCAMCGARLAGIYCLGFLILGGICFFVWRGMNLDEFRAVEEWLKDI